LRFEDAKQIADRAASDFLAEEVDAVYLVFSEFRNAASQDVNVRRLLPVEMPEGEAADYIYEVPPGQLLEKMLAQYVKLAVYQTLLESNAAEHAARMAAMEAASSNAADMIQRLTLHLNRVRQAAITTEIIEVVSGAAASE
jgi:F-type H+-transporting ATPase subunit gamma